MHTEQITYTAPVYYDGPADSVLHWRGGGLGAAAPLDPLRAGGTGGVLAGQCFSVSFLKAIFSKKDIFLQDIECSWDLSPRSVHDRTLP